MKIEFYQTFKTQLELLPRFTVMYSDVRLIAFEWLWFGLWIEFDKKI